MAETCTSRSLSWLVKSCLPDPNPTSPEPHRRRHHHRQNPSSLSSLPDDLLLECLSRVPISSLPSLSLVSRRFSLLLHSPEFLRLRRSHGLLRRSLYAFSFSEFGLLLSSSHFPAGDGATPWDPPSSAPNLPPEILDGSLSHPRVAAVGRSIYVLGRCATVRYDTWTGSISRVPPTLFSRKKFAAASVTGKIYVAGGSSRTAAVEEYDPSSDAWRVVAEAPRRRYGCVGAAADGVFCVVGGLKIGGAGTRDAHVYASSMDLYDVAAGAWLRTRSVPGGGCVVGACGAGARVYVLTSHAVEVWFWRWEGKGRRGGASGEWTRLQSPPVPGQGRVGGGVRFACVGIGESNVAVMVHVSSGCAGDGSRRGGRSAGSSVRDGLVLLYDVVAGEWSRGPDLPAPLRRAASVCVEC